MEILHARKYGQTIPRYEFQELVDEHGDSVYKFCRSLTYCKEDADDLFQETFLHAFERPQAGFSDNPKGYLLSSALYIWKSQKRKYARRKRLAPPVPQDVTIESDVDIEGDFIARDEIRIVRELVEALPDKFKIPTILYYSMEMSVSDIAKTIKLPAGTIKSRLYKARKLVEKGLADVEYER